MRHVRSGHQKGVGNDKRSGSATDLSLERHILALLALRDEGKTICLSEAARAAYRDEPGVDLADEGWRDLMEPARRAARRLVDAGLVVITQGGKPVDPTTATGPIRVRLNHP
ncbi:MAG: hypothetical protein JWQ74_1046 [Marmoricola sp.]|nr:hypothetical protein [Marmoricola sp.]